MIPLGQSAEPTPPSLNQDIDSCKETQRSSEIKYDSRALLWVYFGFLVFWWVLSFVSWWFVSFFPVKAEVPVREKIKKKAENSK